ncbi:uncharacterized protein [Physeter macrocephalus]|uniref:Uncharacterized protein isoform X5 n=1 Tax=Physeter macrocephalus TaxID=9755 RepID=A0A455B7S0_PHYMC|nr:uncharacterized protein LOC114486083 isoform X5 [Physeter catodon]|eukprot:XP_028344043.1 uncharacterized protein LOC114486083 isoform X4 [Physeter catodon]
MNISAYEPQCTPKTPLLSPPPHLLHLAGPASAFAFEGPRLGFCDHALTTWKALPPFSPAPPACAGQRPGLCFAPGPEPGFRLQVTIWKGFIPGQGASHFGSALGPEDSGASAGPKRERGGRVERQAPRPRSGPWDGSPTSALPSPAFLTPQRPLHCCAGATAGPLPASPPSPSPLHLQPGPSLGNVTWSVGPGFGDETQTPELAHRPL